MAGRFPTTTLGVPQRTLAVAYARVSSKEQDREGYSIPAQLKLLRDYAVHQDLDIAREFVDVETAKQAGRGSFGEMLKFLARERTCRALLVEKTDRLYRNLKDWVSSTSWSSRSTSSRRTWSSPTARARPRSSCMGSRS